jgi:hypothetical protein
MYSGIPQGDIPPDLWPVTWIEKPVERAKLIDVLVDVTAHKGGLNRVPGFSDLQRWNGEHRDHEDAIRNMGQADGISASARHRQNASSSRVHIAPRG